MCQAPVVVTYFDQSNHCSAPVAKERLKTCLNESPVVKTIFEVMVNETLSNVSSPILLDYLPLEQNSKLAPPWKSISS